jgi:long-chain acyl-CoA synthetase
MSGAAPLDRRMARTLHVFGFNVVEGYGLTETAPVVTSNTPEASRLGTVGRPLEGVEIALGPDREILVRGPNVMKGYLGKPAETAKVIDRDGWFHTGDQGRIDRYGNLVVTGRIKELIVTSYGKNVAPARVEAMMRTSRFVDQAVLCGDGRKFPLAVVAPNRATVERFAARSGACAGDFRRLLKNPSIRRAIHDDILAVTAELAPFERPKGCVLIHDEIRVGNGMLTPTLKLRRNAIAQKYAEQIEDAYRKLEARDAA